MPGKWPAPLSHPSDTSADPKGSSARIHSSDIQTIVLSFHPREDSPAAYQSLQRLRRPNPAQSSSFTIFVLFLDLILPYSKPQAQPITRKVHKLSILADIKIPPAPSGHPPFNKGGKPSSAHYLLQQFVFFSSCMAWPPC